MLSAGVVTAMPSGAVMAAGLLPTLTTVVPGAVGSGRGSHGGGVLLFSVRRKILRFFAIVH